MAELNYEAKVKVSKNGPYLVSGGVPLSIQAIIVDSEGFPCEWREGDKYPAKENYALCRCGHSKNKPFCDGTHVTINFDGTETANRKPYLKLAETTDGPTLRLTDVEDLCASARFCDRAGGIWELVPKSGDPKARKIAIEEAGNCPAGRLVVWDVKSGTAIEPVFEPSLVLVDDPQAGVSGPIWVRGGIQIESADGVVYELRNRVTLCRCGRSSNKPFCDGSHIPG
jgi:CDGSH-type Zn-finger protein